MAKRKNVFAVIRDYGYDGHVLDSIHATLESAERLVEKHRKEGVFMCEDYIIEECEVLNERT